MGNCTVKVYSPKTGEYINSKTWSAINSEVLNEEFADHLFAKTRSEAFKAWFGDVYNPQEVSSQVVTEDGEPLVVYHSSDQKFDEFSQKFSQELGFHFGTEQAALERHSPWAFGDEEAMKDSTPVDTKEMLRSARNDLKEEMDTFEMYPVFLNIRNMIEGVDYLAAEKNQRMDPEEYEYLYSVGTNAGFNDEFIKLVIAFHQKGTITRDQVLHIFETKDKTELRKALGNPDGYWYKNDLEHKGAISYVVFDPQNIKSIYNIGDFTQDENIFFQKFTAEEKARTIEQVTKEHRSITALKDLSAKLAYRIGGKVEFQNHPNVDWKGYNQGMKSVLNEAYMTPDTPFHEILAHPIIRAIKESDFYKRVNNSYDFIEWVENNKPEYKPAPFMEGIMSEERLKEAYNKYGKEFEKLYPNKSNTFNSLYQSLLKELETGRGKEVFEQVKRDYKYKNTYKIVTSFKDKIFIALSDDVTTNIKNSDGSIKYYNSKEEAEKDLINYNQKYTLEEQQEEAIVTLLGLMAADKLDAKKDATLISKLKALWKQISDFVKSLLTGNISENEINNIIENEVTYTDEENKPCAKDGIRSSKFTKGSQWEIVKDLKGYPSHAQGGVDIKLGKDGFSFTGKDGEIKAANGLVLPKIK